jgi:adenosine deaminase
MKFYYDFGIRVTVNTDNRLMSNTTVTDELMIAAETFDFSLMDVKNIIINGFKSSFLHYRDKVRLLEEILPDLGRTLL